MKKVFKWLKWIILTIIFIILLVLIPIGITRVYENIRASFLTENEKRMEDIDRLEYLFKNEFSGYGVLPGTTKFDAQLAELRQWVDAEPPISQEQFNLKIIKAVASFQDPHTTVIDKNTLLGYRFPYSLTWSEGSFYLLAGQEEFLGSRVTRIGNASSQEVFEKLRAYSNSPNEAGSAYFMNSIISSAELLYHEGIISDRESLEMEVYADGKSEAITYKSLPAEEVTQLTDYVRISNQGGDKELPLYRRNPEKNYWYTSLYDGNIFYLRYSMCIAQGDIEAFWDDVFSTIADTAPEKVVIDVRGNPGGDTQNHNSFLNRIQKDTIVNRYGKLFTLTDRGTGSAAVSFASDMERLTNTILVGEKTMDNPNTTSDPTYFTLPHSNITMVVPSLYSLHSHLHDNRDAVIPEIPIPQNLEGDGYFHDEVMDSIIHMKFDDQYIPAILPAGSEGQYSFSPLRNLLIFQRDSVWYISIDGLTETPVYQKDSVFYTRRYNMTLEFPGNADLMLQLHNSSLTLKQIDQKDMSIEKLIAEGNYAKAKDKIYGLRVNGKLPYFLDRPYFQSRTYTAYNQHGFDDAYELNQLTKEFYPEDPVASIVDFELFQYEGQTLKEITAVFPVVGKLMKRYYTVITTDKVMNDEYNAFIGK